MKAILNQPYKALSGRDDTLVNMKLYGNPVVRSFVTPKNPRSEYQQDIRAYFTAASQGFSLITNSQRDGWKTFAALLTRTNSLGQSYAVSDKALFVEVNVYRQMAGQAITQDAPPITGSGTVISIDYFEFDTPNCEIAITSNDVGGFYVVEMTPQLPGLQKKAGKSDYSLMFLNMSANIVPRTGTRTVISAPAGDFKHAYTVGDRVYVKVTPLGTGYVPGTFHDSGINPCDSITQRKEFRFPQEKKKNLRKSFFNYG